MDPRYSTYAIFAWWFGGRHIWQSHGSCLGIVDTIEFHIDTPILFTACFLGSESDVKHGHRTLL